MAKVKKYQAGGKSSKDSVPSEMFPGKMIPKSKSNYETGKIGKMAEAAKSAVKSAPKKKAKAGGSFPDLNKDGKITKADILKGRGVIKKGGKIAAKKAKNGASLSPSKKSVSSNLGGYKKTIGKAKSGVKMMMGGGKCKYGCK